MPMVYNGKEVEHPHEAVAAALSIEGEPLMPEKRAAIISAMKEIRQTVQESFLEKTPTPDQLELGKRWAQVVDRSRPAELAGDAEFLLHACLYAVPVTQSVLAYIAAAASLYGTDCGLTSPRLWMQLLDFRETAALAFRRLLNTVDFNEAAQYWIELFKKKLAEDWPTNMRLLTVNLIKKAPSPEEAVRVLSGLLKDTDFAEKAKEELALSNNAEVQALVNILPSQPHSPIAGLFDIDHFLVRSPVEQPSDLLLSLDLSTEILFWSPFSNEQNVGYQAIVGAEANSVDHGMMDFAYKPLRVCYPSVSKSGVVQQNDRMSATWLEVGRKIQQGRCSYALI